MYLWLRIKLEVESDCLIVLSNIQHPLHGKTNPNLDPIPAFIFFCGWDGG
jgi:hypothetical protein